MTRLLAVVAGAVVVVCGTAVSALASTTYPPPTGTGTVPGSPTAMTGAPTNIVSLTFWIGVLIVAGLTALFIARKVSARG